MSFDRFRKRPIIIEAVRITEGTFNDPHPDHIKGVIYDPIKRCVLIPTLEGTMKGNIGDWIIRGVAGESYPCKPDIFAATYEPAEKTPWISVTDRLPVANQPVLAATDKVVVRAIYVPHHTVNCTEWDYDGDVEYDDTTGDNYWPEGWYEWNECDDVHWRIGEKVTHWMPLPSVPGAEVKP